MTRTNAVRIHGLFFCCFESLVVCLLLEYVYPVMTIKGTVFSASCAGGFAVCGGEGGRVREVILTDVFCVKMAPRDYC